MSVGPQAKSITRFQVPRTSEHPWEKPALPQSARASALAVTRSAVGKTKGAEVNDGTPGERLPKRLTNATATAPPNLDRPTKRGRRHEKQSLVAWAAGDRGCGSDRRGGQRFGHWSGASECRAPSPYRPRTSGAALEGRWSCP